MVPLLPIPNRTVKRLSADDSAGSRVKVGHRQATIRKPPVSKDIGGFALGKLNASLCVQTNAHNAPSWSDLPSASVKQLSGWFPDMAVLVLLRPWDERADC